MRLAMIARVNTLRTIASKILLLLTICNVRSECWSMLRRIAGGINASEQQAFYRKNVQPESPINQKKPRKPATRVRTVAPGCKP